MKSKKYLAIDIEKHYPSVARIFPNTDYFCPEVPHDQLIPLQKLQTNDEAEKMYDIPCLVEEDLQEEYDIAMIVWPVQSFDDSNDASTLERRTFFQDRIFPILNQKKVKKVLWFDDCDRAIVGKGLVWLRDNGHPCDHVFKREYRRTHVWDYDETVHPFPFMTFGRPNPPWLLYESRTKGNENVVGCFWSGAAINRFQAGVSDEWCNRLGMLKEIHQHLIIKSGMPKEEFLSQFNTYKCFLHLNGTGHLCGRFFEGLSRDSLMMMQQMDVVFPFSEDLFFADECIFEMPGEFIEKYNRLMSDDNLYQQCKRQQELVLEKYYNYSWIREYITSRVD